jgi:hypothetical protein
MEHEQILLELLECIVCSECPQRCYKRPGWGSSMSNLKGKSQGPMCSTWARQLESSVRSGLDRGKRVYERLGYSCVAICKVVRVRIKVSLRGDDLETAGLSWLVLQLQREEPNRPGHQLVNAAQREAPFREFRLGSQTLGELRQGGLAESVIGAPVL